MTSPCRNCQDSKKGCRKGCGRLAQFQEFLRTYWPLRSAIDPDDDGYAVGYWE